MSTGYRPSSCRTLWRGADSTTLLKLYNSTIRSKLDYGCMSMVQLVILTSKCVIQFKTTHSEYASVPSEHLQSSSYKSIPRDFLSTSEEPNLAFNTHCNWNLTRSNPLIKSYSNLNLQSYLQINPNQPQHLASEPSTSTLCAGLQESPWKCSRKYARTFHPCCVCCWSSSTPICS